jgi:hypothetical protein
MGSIGFLVGATVGGFLGVYLFGWLVEKFAFRELPPDSRALRTSLAGWFLTGTLAGFGLADGGGFQWAAYLYYAPGAFLFWLYYRRKLWKAWDDSDVAETFD